MKNHQITYYVVYGVLIVSIGKYVIKKIVCQNKLFSSKEESKYWSKKNNKSPDQILLIDKNYYIFDCEKCSHEYKKK